MSVWKAAKATIKGVADAAHAGAKFVGQHEDTIASGTRQLLQGAGEGVRYVGGAIATGGRKAAEHLHAEAGRADHPITRALAQTGAVVGRAVRVTGLGVERAGMGVGVIAPAVAATTVGVALGGSAVVSEALDSVAIQPTDINALRDELAGYGERIRADAARLEAQVIAAQTARQRDELLDLLVVGGVSLAFVVEHPDAVPAKVQEAFALAYPDLALTESFADVVERLPAEALPGLVSGVKGKLFEVELVQHFNDGGLPDGLHADLAGSATQAGWDIRILDDQGQVVDLLQAKATESAQYVLDALHRYPGIDVVSTSEVHAQLLALGMAENVTNSGITEASLQAAVEHAAGGGHAHFSVDDLLPSGVGLAVIAMSLLLDKKMSWIDRAAQFGQRGVRAGAAGAVAKVAMVVTQTWWIGLVAGVGSSWLATKGRARREQYEALRAAVEILRLRYGRLPSPMALALPAPGS